MVGGGGPDGGTERGIRLEPGGFTFCLLGTTSGGFGCGPVFLVVGGWSAWRRCVRLALTRSALGHRAPSRLCTHSGRLAGGGVSGTQGGSGGDPSPFSRGGACAVAVSRYDALPAQGEFLGARSSPLASF